MADKGKANVRLLTLTAWLSLLVFAATSTLDAVSLKHIGTDLEIGFALKGVLAPTRALILALSTFLIGCLADRFGKRPFLCGGLLIVSLALFSISRSSGYGGLVGGMMVLGMGLGSLEALVSPLVAELHPRQVGTHMNVLHAFFPAGAVVASLIVGKALDAGVNWRTPFAVTAVPAALLAVMFLAARYPEHGAGPQVATLQVRKLLTDRTFWLLALAMALTAGAEGSLIFWSPNFIQHEYGVPAMVGAWGLTSYCIAMAAGRFGTGAVARLVPLDWLMVALAFLMALATLALAVVDNLVASMVLLGLAGLFVACFWPSILALATDRIARRSARLLAMLAVAGIAGLGVMPLAIGMLAERFGLRVGLAIVPVAMAISGFVLLKVAGKGQPYQAEECS